MYYKNTLSKLKKLNYKLLNLNFSTTKLEKNDSTTPQLCVNFKAVNNQLVNSYGETTFQCYESSMSDEIIYPKISDISGLRDIKFFIRSSKDKSASSKKQIYARNLDNTIYYSNLDDGVTNVYDIIQLEEGCQSKMFTYFHDTTNYMIITTNNQGVYKMLVFDGFSKVAEVEIETPSMIYDICKHNNFLFLATEDSSSINNIYYSGNINPLSIDFSSMGSISIPAENGKVLKLVSMDDLYIFCEYGIYKITTYVNQRSMDIENVYVGNYRIIENSIVACGDEIMFADENGIYRFNGTSVTKVDFSLGEMFETIDYNGVACFNDGKYYFATKVNYSDGIVDDYDMTANNSLIIYDLHDESIEICCDICIKKMITYQDSKISRIALLTEYNGKVTLNTLTNNGQYNSKASKKIWTSQQFDYDEVKLLRKIYINTTEQITVNLHTDKGDFSYILQGSDSEQKITINKKVKSFTISLLSETNNPIIKSCKLMVGTYE